MANMHIEHTQCFQSSHATASGALFASAKLHRFSVTTGSQGGTCCEYLFVMLNTLYSSPPPPWSQRFTWIDSSQLAWTDCDRTTNKLEANLMTGNAAPSFSCQVQLLALVSSRQQLLQFMLRVVFILQARSFMMFPGIIIKLRVCLLDEKCVHKPNSRQNLRPVSEEALSS